MDDFVDDPELREVIGSQFQDPGGFGGTVRVAPQDLGGTFRPDDGKDRPAERNHGISRGERERTATTAFTRDDGDDWNRYCEDRLEELRDLPCDAMTL